MPRKSRRDGLLFWKFLISLSTILSIMSLVSVSGLYNILSKENIVNTPTTETRNSFNITSYFVLSQSPVLGMILAIILAAAFFLKSKI